MTMCEEALSWCKHMSCIIDHGKHREQTNCSISFCWHNCHHKFSSGKEIDDIKNFVWAAPPLNFSSRAVKCNIQRTQIFLTHKCYINCWCTNVLSSLNFDECKIAISSKHYFDTQNWFLLHSCLSMVHLLSVKFTLPRINSGIQKFTVLLGGLISPKLEINDLYHSCLDKPAL